MWVFSRLIQICTGRHQLGSSVLGARFKNACLHASLNWPAGGREDARARHGGRARGVTAGSGGRKRADRLRPARGSLGPEPSWHLRTQLLTSKHQSVTVPGPHNSPRRRGRLSPFTDGEAEAQGLQGPGTVFTATRRQTPGRRSRPTTPPNPPSPSKHALSVNVK